MGSKGGAPPPPPSPPSFLFGLEKGEEISAGRTEAAKPGVRVEQVCEVRRGLVVKSFIAKEKEFEVDALWEPV